MKLYRSTGDVALVPTGVTTVMSTMPLPAGDVATISLSLTTWNVAEVEPKLTAVAPVNPLPKMETLFPPLAGPWFGVIPAICGTAW